MQYDTFQIPFQCCAPPFKPLEQNWVDGIRGKFQITMASDIPAPSTAFSPACWSHCITESTYSWANIQINGNTLNKFAGQWFFQSNSVFPPLIDHCSGFNCTKGCPG
jgi:hypothetical protein